MSSRASACFTTSAATTKLFFNPGGNEEGMQETKLEVGAIFEGKVTGITKFGAFVDIGGGKTGMVMMELLFWIFLNYL